MTCDNIRQLLLSLDLDNASRQRVGEAIAHVNSCEACRLAMGDFDQLARMLQRDGDDQAVAAGLPEHVNQDGITPRGGWEQFEASLLAVQDVGRRRSFPMDLYRWIPALGGLAAILLVGWAAYHQGKRSSGTDAVARTPESLPSESKLVHNLRLSSEEVAAGLRAFNAIDKSFEGQTHWLLLTANNKIEAGTTNQVPQAAQSPATRDANGKILLVRLNLVGGTDVVCEADLLILAGMSANVVVPTKLGPMHYHVVTSASDPMKVSVRLQVPSEVAVQTGTPTTAGSEQAILGTSLELTPYTDASAGRLMIGRQAFDLQVAAATSNLPGL